MKRRILASLLTLVMMLSLLPTAALANGETNDSPSPSQPSTKYDWNDYGGYYDSATEGEIRYVTNPKEIEDLYTEIYKAAGEAAKISVIEKAVKNELIANNLAARLKEVVHVYTVEERSKGVHFQKNANTNLNDFVATVTGDEMLISGDGALMAYNKYNDVFYAPSNASIALRPWNTERVGEELSSVRFGYGITEVGEYAFFNQPRQDITSASFNANMKIHLPDSLQKMSQATFMSLNVGKIAIPASVTSLSTRQFASASAMYVLGNPQITTTTSDSFATGSGTTNVYVAKGSELASTSGITNMNLKEVDAIGGCGADEHYTSEMVWMVDGDTLTITAMDNGSGAMADYSDSNPAPWNAYADQIKKIVLSSGVKNIGANAFKALTGVNNVTVPASVEIDTNAANPFAAADLNTISFGYSEGSSFEAWLNAHGYTGETNRDTLGRIKLTKAENEYFHEYIGDTDIAAKMTKDGVLTIYPTYCANGNTDVPNVDGYHGDNTGFPWFDVFYDESYKPDVDSNGKLNNWSGAGQYQQYLTKIVWVDGLTATGGYLFNGASNMPSTPIELQIPDSVKNVGAFILGNAESDPEVIVPVGATNVGSAFNGKGNIAKNVYILNAEMTGIPVQKKSGNTTTDSFARNICYGFDYTVHVKESSKAYDKLASGNYTIQTHTDMGACGAAKYYSSEVFWLYDADTKTLTIKGNGAIKDYTSAAEAPWSKYDVKHITLDSGITRIGEYAFANLLYIKQADVAIGAGVKVADNAFAKPDAHGRMPLPQSDDLYYNSYIGDTTIAAKMSKDGVVTIYPTDTTKDTVVPGLNGYQGDNTLYPWYAVYGKTFDAKNWDSTGVHASEIKEIVFADGLTKIGGYLFNYVTGMPTNIKVHIPNSVTEVDGALVGSKNYGSHVAVGEPMTRVEFWYAGSAKDVYILNPNMKKIPFAPSNQPTRNIAYATTGADIRMHVKEGSEAYNTVTKEGTTYTNVITHTDMGACGVAPYSSEVFWTYDADSKTLTVLGDGAIKDYASASDAPWHNFDVETLLVQSGVTEIGNNAFASLNKLQMVHVADSVAEVADTAFATENGKIVASLKNTTFLTGSDAMNDWLGKHGANVLPSSGVVGNYKWSISGDVLTIEVNGADSTDELGEKSAVVSSITADSVPAWAAYKSMITKVQIGYGVTEIGDKVFSDMPVLSSVELPSSLTKIGAEAFANTPKLTKIYLPKKTIDVAATAFGTSSSAAKNLTVQVSPVAPDSQKNMQSQGNTAITVDDTKNLNVLLIGNSYFGALSGYMKNIAQGLGKSDAMIANYYFGGDSGNLAAYVQRINNKTIGTYNPEKDVFSGYKENGVRNDSYNSNPLSMGIEAKDWDYVVMETWGKKEPAGANGVDKKLSQDPNLTDLKNYIAKYAPQAEVSLYHVYSCRYLAENVTPVETLTEQWQRYVDGADDGLKDIVAHVIPASTLIQNARLTYLNANGSELQRNPPSDITHLTGEGDYINAIMMYEMLTGKSTAAFDHSSFDNHKEAFYHKLVDVTKAAGMKKLTYAYVKHNNTITYYDSLSAAANAAVAGDTLSLLAMPKSETLLTLASGITVETFGSSEDHTIVLTAGGRITASGLIAFAGCTVDNAAATTQTAEVNPETGVITYTDAYAPDAVAAAWTAYIEETGLGSATVPGSTMKYSEVPEIQAAMVKGYSDIWAAKTEAGAQAALEAAKANLLAAVKTYVKFLLDTVYNNGSSTVLGDTAYTLSESAYETASSEITAATTEADVLTAYNTALSKQTSKEHPRMTKTDAVAATCTENGNNEYYTCETCHNVFKDAAGTQETTVAAETFTKLGHNMAKIEAKAVTCTENGNNEYYICNVCHKVFKDQAGTRETTVAAEIVKAPGKHDWSNKDGVCKVCKTPCGEAHTAGTTCPVCGKYTPIPVVPAGEPAKNPFNPDAGKTRFVDVSDNAWYASAVNYVVDKGLMNGTGSNKFSPNADTTRGMIVIVLARLDGKNTAGTPWFAAGQRWAMEYEISDGTNMTGAITREQLVTMLFRYAVKNGLEAVTLSENLTQFTDASDISAWAVSAMQWAVGQGLIQGSNGQLRPQANASRAEVATILMRFCELMKK